MQPPPFNRDTIGFQSNSLDTAAQDDWMDALVRFLFSAEGRVSRSQYWISNIVFAIVNQVILYLLLRPLIALFTGVALPPESPWYTMAEYLTLLVAYALLLWWTVVVAVKRWHDLGKSGLWELLIFVPVIGWLWKLIMCGFVPGTPGTNPYGRAVV